MDAQKIMRTVRMVAGAIVDSLPEDGSLVPQSSVYVPLLSVGIRRDTFVELLEAMELLGMVERVGDRLRRSKVSQ